ncbi:MAG: ATP synthase F1 subunit epsilon [Proteobacteria bacterium]|nr:ATP synthase F1 subunit epsilon [Pseudomonadota bacterium]
MSPSNEIQVEILSPEKSLFKGVAGSVMLPGKLGYMAILPGHAKMIAELGVGLLELSDLTGQKTPFFIAGGFVEVDANVMRVLVDVIEKPGDIDLTRAQKAESRARERLSSHATQDDLDYARAQAALMRAQARIALAGVVRL